MLPLQELKRTKKNKMCAPPGRPSDARPPRAEPPLSQRIRCIRRKEIIRTMESFNNNLQGGKKLVKALEKQTVLSTPRTPPRIAYPSSPRSLTLKLRRV